MGRKRKHSAVTADHNDAEEGPGAAAGAAAGAASGAAAGAPVRSRRQSLVALGVSIVRRSVPAALARVQTGLQAMLESLGAAAAADHSSSSAAASSSSSSAAVARQDQGLTRVLDAIKAADAAISKLPPEYLQMVNAYLSEVGPGMELVHLPTILPHLCSHHAMPLCRRIAMQAAAQTARTTAMTQSDKGGQRQGGEWAYRRGGCSSR